MENSPSFFDKVYFVTRNIPKGQVTTYGAIARIVGSPKAARMVGWALNKSGTVMPPVPAHRVVNRKGRLSGAGYFSYPGQMKELLEEEGIQVAGETIVDLPSVLWDPMLHEEELRKQMPGL